MSVRPAISTPASERADPRRSLGLERCTLAVLMGGRSSEREVSLSSGRMVLRALTSPATPDDQRGPARVLGVELRADGTWQVGPRCLGPGRALEELDSVDLFFSALHGGEGENGALQGLLSCCDRRFTGSGVISSALCLDKLFARTVVAAAGVRVAPGLCLAGPDAPVPADLWQRLGAAGCVVKPRRGGSSVGCSLVHEPAQLPAALARAFEQGRQVLVEAYVQGVEVTGGVLQEPGGELLALPPVEIRPRASFFDYREKYAEDGALELCPPESLSSERCARIQERALACHEALGCAGYSRTDFLVPARGEPVFLETNTLPGLTPRSLLPRAAAELGIDYRTLCLWIAAHGLSAAREEG